MTRVELSRPFFGVRALSLFWNSSSELRPFLFSAERLDRVNACSATRREPAGEKRDRCNKCRNGNECRRIPHADAEEQTAHQLRAGERAEESESNADANQRHCLADDEPEDRGRQCA